MIARLAICMLIVARAAAAAPPGPLANAGIDERVGAKLPLDTPFVDTRIGPTTLRAVLDPARPTLLVLAYARCTMLCNVLLRGVVDVARRMEKVPGRDYKLVLIGLDDRETLDEGRRRQSALLAELVRGDWSYLHGDRASIDAIADPLGFRYAWDPRTEQYAHPAVMFVLTPEGRAARYLHGLAFDPHEVNAALDDAAAGRLLSTPAAAVLRCFQFDPAARRNGPRIALFMRLGAALVFLLGLLGIGGLVRSRRRRT